MNSESTLLTAIIITKNEESNIERCLNSLKWVKEIVMVDSGSTDKTLEIANKFSNVKVIRTIWEGYSENKRKAVREATHDWILWVDADEEISEELKTEISRIHFYSNSFHAYDIPRKTFFMGEWVQHTGWYPGRVIRLFNKNHCDFNNHVLHEGVELSDSSKLGHLKSDIHHYSYKTLYQYFDKMNYYGRYGAEELFRKGKKFNLWQLLFNPWATFIKFYFFKKGFLDGKKGFIISVGSAFSNFIKYTNFYYLNKAGK